MTSCCEILKVPNTIFSNASCCSPAKSSPWVKRIGVICRIFLCVIGVVIAPLAFPIALAAGLVTGACYLGYKHWKGEPVEEAGTSKPVCAQGNMDFLADMRFPEVVGSIGIAAFLADHLINHNATFYAPFTGFFLGFWFSRKIHLVGNELLTFHKKSDAEEKRTLR